MFTTHFIWFLSEDKEYSRPTVNVCYGYFLRIMLIAAAPSPNIKLLRQLMVPLRPAAIGGGEDNV